MITFSEFLRTPRLKDEGISMDEDAIFKRDIESLPETSADSYERLPIENFGKVRTSGCFPKSKKDPESS